MWGTHELLALHPIQNDCLKTSGAQRVKGSRVDISRVRNVSSLPECPSLLLLGLIACDGSSSLHHRSLHLLAYRGMTFLCSSGRRRLVYDGFLHVEEYGVKV